MIKAILFDLGEVLFTNGTKKFVEYTSEKYGIDKEKIKNVVDKGEIPDAYREGRIGRDEFWTKVKQELNLAEDIETLEREWINRYELIEGTKDILQELAKKYKVYFLSDNVKERVEAIDKKFDFLSWFETGVFSHEVGVRKPHPKIYQIALQKAGVKPEEAIFIDDNESALKPASQMGMITILFISPEQLKDRIKELKILY